MIYSKIENLQRILKNDPNFQGIADNFDLAKLNNLKPGKYIVRKNGALVPINSPIKNEVALIVKKITLAEDTLFHDEVHDRPEIMIPVIGQETVSIENDIHIPIKKGYFLLIEAGELHECFCKKGSFKKYIIKYS